MSLNQINPESEEEVEDLEKTQPKGVLRRALGTAERWNNDFWSEESNLWVAVPFLATVLTSSAAALTFDVAAHHLVHEYWHYCGTEEEGGEQAPHCEALERLHARDIIETTERALAVTQGVLKTTTGAIDFVSRVQWAMADAAKEEIDLMTSTPRN